MGTRNCRSRFRAQLPPLFLIPEGYHGPSLYPPPLSAEVAFLLESLGTPQLSLLRADASWMLVGEAGQDPTGEASGNLASPGVTAMLVWALDSQKSSESGPIQMV